jgi:lauroyl/myristoyl acyltransferase
MDPAWTALLDRGSRALAPGAVDELAARMRRALDADASFDGGEAARRFWRMRLEDAWGRARGVRRVRWRPRVRIEGLERLESALSRGRGAIVWGMRLASATAIKQAFHRAGHPLVHLSRAQHGSPTQTKLGIGLAAPLYRRAEDPYLRERVTIPLDGSPRYLQTLRARLRENACVSIFGEHAGRQNVTCRVLTTRLEFAIGAPSLAWAEDAALLTVSAHREAPLAYRVVIGEEIPVDRSQPRKVFAEQAVEELARRLEELIVRYPWDWQGWAYHEFA